MDGVSAASAIIGIIVPALHGARILYDDIEKVVHIDKILQPINNDLKALVEVLSSLERFCQDVNTPQEALEALKQNNVEPASKNCQTVCSAFQAKLDKWTKHSKDGKVAWRDKFVPGFFGESDILEFRTQLVACKGTFTIGLQMANISISASQTVKANDIVAILATMKAEMDQTATATMKQITDLTTQLAVAGSQTPNAPTEVTGDKSYQDIIALFKEALAKADTQVDQHRIKIGKIKQGDKNKVLFGVHGFDSVEGMSVNLGDAEMGNENVGAIGVTKGLNMDKFF